MPRIQQRSDEPQRPWPDSFPIDTLVGRVRDHIRSAAFDPPPIPSVAQEVWSACTRGEATAMEIARIVQRGPLLAGRVMKLANSALLSGSEPARTLRDAIVRIGLDELVNIVLMVSLRGALYDTSGFLHLGEASRRSAVAASVAASLLAERTGAQPPARAFLAGLLHDLGEPILMHAMEKILGQAYCRAMSERDFLALNAEIHAEVGLEVAARWKIDGELVAVIGRHSEWSSPTPPSPLLRLVMLADAFVAELGLGLARELPAPEEHPAAQTAPFTPALLAQVRKELPAHFARYE